MSDDDVKVLIKGADRSGIPLDVFGSITGAISVLYPNARMGAGEWGQGVTLILGPEDRRNTVKGRKRAIAAQREHNENGLGDVDVIGYEDDTLKTTAPEESSRILLEHGLAFIENEGGANYVEQRAMLPDGRGLVLTVQWLHGKSAHQQRKEAEQQLDATVQELVDLRNAIDSHIEHDGDRVAGCLVCEHMGPKAGGDRG